MSSRIKNPLCIFLKLVWIFLFPGLVFAQSVQMTSDSNLSFGLIEFSIASHQGELTVGTNGGVTLSGSGLYYQDGAVPAQITITGNSGVVEIKCESTATLAANGSTLEITDIDAALNTGAPPGAGQDCNGVAGANPDAIVADLGAEPNPRIFFGGKLNILSGSLSGGETYNTSSGGNPLTISATFQ